MSTYRIGSSSLEQLISHLDEETRLKIVPETYLGINGKDTASRIAVKNEIFLTIDGLMLGLISTEGDVSKWGDLEGGYECIICVNEKVGLFSREDLGDITF